MLDFIKKIVSSIKNKGRGPIIKRKRSSYAPGRASGVCLAVVSIVSIGVAIALRNDPGQQPATTCATCIGS